MRALPQSAWFSSDNQNPDDESGSIFETEDKRELIEQLPWKMMNTQELVVKGEDKTFDRQLDIFKEQLTSNKDGLRDGIEMTFDLLHESIV